MQTSETVEVEVEPMRAIRVAKVVINIGVGRSGEALERAAKVLQGLVNQKPSVRRAKKTIRDFGIHKGEPIGVMVTLRGQKALALLDRLLTAKGRRLPESLFDEQGSCSFGIREHIEIPGVKYDPSIGIFGMDVSVVLERPGLRVARRKRASSRVPAKQRVGREEAIAFFRDELKVEVY